MRLSARPPDRLASMLRRRQLSQLVVASALLCFAPAEAKRKTSTPKTVSITLETSSTAIEVGDSFQLDVVVTATTTRPIQELSLPDFGTLRVLRDHRSTIKTRKRMGRRSLVQTEYRYTYLLTADSAGRKRIGGARVRIGSDVATASAVSVNVKGSSRTPLPRDARGDPASKPGENLPPYFFDVSFNKNEAFLGEGVTLTARLYATSSVSGRALDSPQWKQFWVEELGGSGSRPVQREIEGRRYYVYTVSRKAVFPLETGELVVPPMSMQVETGSGTFGRGRSMVLRSDPATLVSKALPSKGRQETFSLGNVGQWRLDANISPRRLKVGEAATLRLTATGVGNVGQLTLPSLEKEISGVRLFPPSFNERKTVDGGKVAGVKMVEALVQPTRTGRIEIPSYTLAYFDPETGKYREAKTKPMRLQVTSAKGIGAQGVAGAMTKKDIAAGARPVHLGMTATSGPLGAWPAGAGAVLGLLSWISLALIGRRRERLGGDAASKRQRRARSRKKAMASAHGEKDLGRARALVTDALVDRAGESVRALPQAELVAACIEAGLGEDRARALAAFFDAVDAVRFTPQSSQSRQQLFDEGARLQQALDDEVQQ